MGFSPARLARLLQGGGEEQTADGPPENPPGDQRLRLPQGPRPEIERVSPARGGLAQGDKPPRGLRAAITAFARVAPPRRDSVRWGRRGRRPGVPAAAFPDPRLCGALRREAAACGARRCCGQRWCPGLHSSSVGEQLKLTCGCSSLPLPVCGMRLCWCNSVYVLLASVGLTQGSVLPAFYCSKICCLLCLQTAAVTFVCLSAKPLRRALVLRRISNSYLPVTIDFPVAW